MSSLPPTLCNRSGDPVCLTIAGGASLFDGRQRSSLKVVDSRPVCFFGELYLGGFDSTSLQVG